MKNTPLRTLLGVVVLGITIVGCTTRPEERTSPVQWGHQVDSLLRDTTTHSAMVDSLRALLREERNDTVAIDRLNALSQYYRGFAARVAFQEAEKRSLTMGYAYGAIDALCRAGIHALRSSRLAEADSLFALSGERARKGTSARDTGLVAQALMWRGQVYYLVGENRTALAFTDTALALAWQIADTGRIAACLGGIGSANMWLGDTLKAREALEASIRWARMIGDRDRLAFCHTVLGDLARVMSSIDLAIAHYDTALTIAEAIRDRTRISVCLNALGEMKYTRGDLPAAITYQLRSQALASSVEDPMGYLAAEYRLGELYNDMGDSLRALESFQKAIAGGREHGIPSVVAPSLLAAAQLHHKADRLPEAMRDLDEAISVSERSDNTSVLISALVLSGRLKAILGDGEEAKKVIKRALEIGERTANVQLDVVLREAAEVEFGTGDRALALRYAERAYALDIEKGSMRGTSESARILASILEGLGRLGDALPIYKHHIRLRDALENEDLSRKMKEIDFNARADIMRVERERELAVLAARVLEQRQKKRYALMGTAFAVLLAGAMFNMFRASRRNAAALATKNEEILRAQSQVVEAEKQRENEQVRTRIARDIHDDIGSGLTKITMLGNDAKRRLGDASEDVRSSLERIIGHSREVSTALSDIVWTVDPLHDTSAELVSHARTVTQRLLEGTDMRAELRFTHNEPPHAVPPNTKHHVIMVLKEALNNAMKYAGNSSVQVDFTAGDHRLRVHVRDGGPGFDATSAGLKGNGLRNMRKRAEAIGARLSVTSGPGKGCSVELLAPVA